jgi:UDP-N-acetylglucosamine acyltransferase
MSTIHPSAEVDKDAEIGNGVEIGPFCVIGPNVKIGDNSVLHSHVSIAGHTTLGSGNEIFPYASLGHIPQDLKFDNEKSFLEIGDGNRIRENVTINLGTKGGGGITRVGNNGLFMVGAHVAHDCIVGDNIVMANNAALGGHVEVENNVIFGGFSAIHQFSKAGKFSFIGAGAMVTGNVIPFATVMGDRACLSGLNLVGLKRANFKREDIHSLRGAYKVLFSSSDVDLLEERVQQAEDQFGGTPLVKDLLIFIKSIDKRGLCLPRQT